ncbi:MAG: outer membrane protein assembly factor BamD [Burkholderiales bacterium]|nr:outer membrane protein assembly factor BamD [Burkholderiales bacterium]
MTRSFLAGLTLVLASTLLTGCGFFGDKLDPKKNWSVEEFYKNAREELDSGNYAGAVKSYEALEAKYPFGRYAQQAQLDIAYAYYKDGETAQCVSAADRFLKLHPNHQNADYALYIKALAYFKPDLGIFGEFLNLDPAERDPKALRESFEVFKELVTRFPDSRYGEDARARMAFLVNALAKHDVAVARYYLARGAFLAAANRAQNVFQRYPQAPAIEDALVISVQAYEQMGMTELAGTSRRVLEKNFPKNNAVAGTSSAGKAWWKLW